MAALGAAIVDVERRRGSIQIVRLRVHSRKHRAERLSAFFRTTACFSVRLAELSAIVGSSSSRPSSTGDTPHANSPMSGVTALLRSSQERTRSTRSC